MEKRGRRGGKGVKRGADGLCTEERKRCEAHRAAVTERWKLKQTRTPEGWKTRLERREGIAEKRSKRFVGDGDKTEGSRKRERCGMCDSVLCPDGR